MPTTDTQTHACFVLHQEYARTQSARLDAGGAFSYGLVKDTKEVIKWGPTEGDPATIVMSIPVEPLTGFRSINTFSVTGWERACSC
ncbi:unnamed protein product [Ectocarpus sp. CCAP 1310/34]|nr:unnamed protein product [Ectocarpus sp. CCAP 1310/34]